MPAIIPAFAGVAEAVRDFRKSSGLEETSANFLPTMSFHLLTWDIEGELVSLEVRSSLLTVNVPLVLWWGNDSIEFVGRVLLIEFKVACATIQHFSSKLFPMWKTVRNSRTGKQECASASYIPLLLVVLAYHRLLSRLCTELYGTKCSVWEEKVSIGWKYFNFCSAFQSMTSSYL